MYKRAGAALLTVTAAIALGVALSVVPGGTPFSVSESTSISSEPSPASLSVAAPPPVRQYEAPPSSLPVETGYYIKDWNGRVAILREGEDTPEMIFDISTKTLPQYDQEQLRDGLYVQSYEELAGLIEDYIS